MDFNLNDYGFDRVQFDCGKHGCIPARVTQVQRERYGAICVEGTVWARLKKSSFQQPDAVYPTVGDFVYLRYNPTGDSMIEETLPRRSFFERRDSFSVRGRQAVAANFDYVFIVTSMNDEYRTRRLERYLSQARSCGAQPVIILTKKDIGRTEAIESAQAAAGDAPVHAVSAKTGEGLDEIRPYLTRGATIVLMGSSGVGKSTLVNALAGTELMATGAIREDDDKGRHTTTHRQMLMMPSGTAIIDTPGMRELGLWDSMEGVQDTFEDIETLAANCRFRDCTHTREPGCAIRMALGSGELEADRVRSWIQLCAEADATARRAQKQEKMKQIAQFSRARKKHAK